MAEGHAGRTARCGRAGVRRPPCCSAAPPVRWPAVRPALPFPKPNLCWNSAWLAGRGHKQAARVGVLASWGRGALPPLARALAAMAIFRTASQGDQRSAAAPYLVLGAVLLVLGLAFMM